MGLKIQGVSAYNFGTSGSNDTKLFHATCRVAWVFKWALLLGMARPLKFGRAKTTIDFDREYLSKLHFSTDYISARFETIQTSIANISGTGRDIQNRKDICSPTVPPAFNEESPVNFGPLTTENGM